tara:strand:+ start:1357 stop:1911 length:555 start_codon:yes stop_codon:yes gene_type:complete
MFKFLSIFFILFFPNIVFSSIKENIVSKMQVTNILSFDFIQTIDEKKENGSCIIKYPKKMYCEYTGSNKKIIVSNGKSVVIKYKNSGNYYIYSLKKTPFELLLNKNFLISQIKNLKSKLIDNKFIAFKITENNNEISIFFNKKNFNLVGWQTEDIYQNLSITFISSIEINPKIDDKIFILPIND